MDWPSWIFNWELTLEWEHVIYGPRTRLMYFIFLCPLMYFSCSCGFLAKDRLHGITSCLNVSGSVTLESDNRKLLIDLQQSKHQILVLAPRNRREAWAAKPIIHEDEGLCCNRDKQISSAVVLFITLPCPLHLVNVLWEGDEPGWWEDVGRSATRWIGSADSRSGGDGWGHKCGNPSGRKTSWEAA